ncbi:hypothetical protein ABZ772_34235, partial [Streptomyces griseoincarnatus]
AGADRLRTAVSYPDTCRITTRTGVHSSGTRPEEEDNAEHRRVRARVEQAVARMKNCKILRDCRQRSGDGLHHAVQAVAHMHNLALAA